MIPGYFDRSHPWVKAQVIITGTDLPPFDVPFLIDTGSRWPVVHPVDSGPSGVWHWTPPVLRESSSVIQGVGGFTRPLVADIILRL